jgi:ABC-type nitrate/sulfonate/bicarbonate transport system ATPase subunit
MVFQSYTLFPWLTVAENIAFGPRERGVPKAEQDRLVERYIAQVGLKGFENHYPKQLSGGMQQRTALARALANDPRMLLMDEPFGALDALTRARLQDELMKIVATTGATVMMVTHDVDEAVLLSDRIVMMTNGPAATNGATNSSFIKLYPDLRAADDYIFDYILAASTATGQLYQINVVTQTENPMVNYDGSTVTLTNVDAIAQNINEYIIIRCSKIWV